VGYAIEASHLSKVYRLGALGTRTLGQDLNRWWTRVRKQPESVSAPEHGREKDGDFWALRDVGFTVGPGEVLGVIGRNGAGKSTLLKLLSQVTAPSTGRIRMRGRIASLLEVGTGFHPDLTGRENVFLNGAILGMTRTETRRNFDEIVAFSECEAFIDTPVKRYSSGMYVRLAFAVAAHLQPEILIVDEVLAVGDAQFQRKCLGKMRDVSSAGRTVLFVSHSIAAISALCTRVLLLRDGALAADGPPTDVIPLYQAVGAASTGAEHDFASRAHQGNGKARFTTLSVRSETADGEMLAAPVPGCDLVVETEIRSIQAFSLANVALIFSDSQGYRLIDVNTAIQGEFLSLSAGECARVRFKLRDLLLKPGTYSLAVYLGRAGMEMIDYVESAAMIEVFDSSASRHTEVFPGTYQCRFDHEVSVEGRIQSPAVQSGPAF
jgi:lipopolysaccharide transport system ATP-binding protein